MLRNLEALGLFTLVLSVLLNATFIAVCCKKLVERYRPDNKVNTWGRAFVVGTLIAILSVCTNVAALELNQVWILIAGGLVVPPIMIAEAYDVGYPLGFGIYLLIMLATAVFGVCLLVAIFFLAPIHPMLPFIALGSIALGYVARRSHQPRSQSPVRTAGMNR